MIMTITAAISTPPLLQVDKMKPLLESHGSSGMGLRVCFLGFVVFGICAFWDLWFGAPKG